MRVSLFALLVFAAATVRAQVPAAGTSLEGIVAVIGDQVVLKSEVDALVQQATASQRQLPPDVWSRALDQLIDNRVLIDNARRDTTLSVTDQMVSEEVERNVAQLTAQAGSQAALEEAFGRPLSQIRESFREEVRDELLLQQYRGRRLRDLSVTPGEVRTFYDALPVEARTETVPELVRVAHVVKKPAPGQEAKAEARAFAQTLRDSVAAGQATLGALANRHSTDPGNTNRDGTQNGGSYENFALRDLDPTFAAAAAALEPGGLSQVVRDALRLPRAPHRRAPRRPRLVLAHSDSSFADGPGDRGGASRAGDLARLGGDRARAVRGHRAAPLRGPVQRQPRRVRLGPAHGRARPQHRGAGRRVARDGRHDGGRRGQRGRAGAAPGPVGRAALCAAPAPHARARAEPGRRLRAHLASRR